jgi:K+/H+ antiporter YhaU regulatory subunit KhtT
MKPNEEFKLSVRDIEIIEDSLHKKIRALTEQRLTLIQSTNKPEWEIDSVKQIDEEVKEVNQLLGRLYHQKNFYRPKNEIYVGG